MTEKIDLLNAILADIEKREQARQEEELARRMPPPRLPETYRAPVRTGRPATDLPLRKAPIESEAIEQDPAFARNNVAPATPLHTDEVAEWLGCSKWTVNEKARKGEIPHRKVPGFRPLIFYVEELAEWIDGAPLEVTVLKGDGRIVRPVAARRVA
jgi:excisionase family DNA binding protein